MLNRLGAGPAVARGAAPVLLGVAATWLLLVPRPSAGRSLDPPRTCSVA